MEPLFVLARTGLALVLGIAGFAKLGDREGSRQAMLDFGVPERLASFVALILPAAELGVAAALLPAVTARPAALAAGLLFLVFLAAIAYQLVRGRHPDCPCFGQLHSKPIGLTTLVRNGALLLLAGTVAAAPAPAWRAAAFGWIGALGRVETLLLTAIALFVGVVVAEAWLLLNLTRQQGRMLLRLDRIEAGLDGGGILQANPGPPPGLRVGTAAPAFALPSLEGQTISLDDLRQDGLPVLLLSVDPGCGPCASLLPDVAEWQHAHAQAITVAVLTRGSAEANHKKLATQTIARVLLQKRQEVAALYEAIATPSAILVDADGKIAAPLAAGAEEIRRLVERTVRPPRRLAEGLPVGAPAPTVALRDLDGNRFDLTVRAGLPTVLLFWNPGCGFCRRMLPQLNAWEAERPADTGLVLVSSGEAETNREMGLRSTVLLENDFQVGRSYGASGTPSAVMIDEAGRVGSILTVGAPGVLGLLAQLEPSETVIRSA